VIELQPDKSDTYSALAAVWDASDRHDEAYALLSSAASRFDADARFQFKPRRDVPERQPWGDGDDRVPEGARAGPLPSRGALPPRHPGALGGDVPEATKRLETYVSLTGQNPQNLATAQKLLESLKKPGGK